MRRASRSGTSSSCIPSATGAGRPAAGKWRWPTWHWSGTNRSTGRATRAGAAATSCSRGRTGGLWAAADARRDDLPPSRSGCPAPPRRGAHQAGAGRSDFRFWPRAAGPRSGAGPLRTGVRAQARQRGCTARRRGQRPGARPAPGAGPSPALPRRRWSVSGGSWPTGRSCSRCSRRPLRFPGCSK